MEITEFDTLVIGAGAAGLIGALEIARAGKTVAIIEAKEKPGGRIATIRKNGYTFELGAEFMHGNLPLTQMILQKAGARTYAINGSIWQHKNGRLEKQEDFIEEGEVLEQKFKTLEKDKPVAAFLNEDLAEEKYNNLRLSIRNYVEGYYAADTARASTAALCQEWTKGDEEQYHIEGGYHVLVDWLEKQCREAGVRFFFHQPVLELHWQKDKVRAITAKGSLVGTKALITVSVGVLQQEKMVFAPELPEVKKWLQKLGFGHVIKVLLHFKVPFWKERSITGGKDLSDLSFLFAAEEIPTWWTRAPENEALLTGWLGGPGAENIQHLSTAEIQHKAVYSISRIFGLDEARLQQNLEEMFFYNWSADPHFCGAYSYEVVGGEEIIQKMQQPVEATLFFAGEGLQPGPQIGTVEGALQNGRSAAHRLLFFFSS